MRPKHILSKNLWLALGVFAIVGGNCIRWSQQIAADGAPDEADHFAIVQFVAAHGRLPRYGEDGLAVHLMAKGHQRLPPETSGDRLQFLLGSFGSYELRLPYLFSPQMPYWLAGMVCRTFGGATVARARSFNSICIALAAVCTLIAGVVLWASPWPAAIAALCFGLWPQVTFIGAYVNDDAFAVLTLALFLLAASWVERDGMSRQRAVFLGLALGAIASAKFYVFAALPLILAWGVFAWRRARGWRRSHVLLALAVATVLATPLWVRNAVLYRGDFLGRRTAAKEAARYVESLPSPVRAKTHLLFTQQEQGLTLAKIFARGFLRQSLESFWGRFGWMNIQMQRGHYAWALAVVGGALALSWLGLPLARHQGGAVAGVPHLFAVPFLLLLVGLALYNCLYVDYQPQGRYFLTCVPALCLQLMEVPARASRQLGHVPRLALVAASLSVLTFFVLQNVVAFRLLEP